MSVIAQKIESARFNADAYPHLQKMIAHIDEAMGAAIASSCRVTELAQTTDAQMVDTGPDAEGGAFYFFSGADDNDTIITGLTPRFLMTLSECLLGAEFSMPEDAMPEEAMPGALDVRLAEAFVVELAQSLDGWFAAHAPKADNKRFHLKAALSDPKEIEKALPGGAYFQVAVHVKPDPEKTIQAAFFLFPVAFLEDRGLMAQGRPQKAEAVNAEWRAKMLNHVNASEIDVDVIMDRYTALLSDVAAMEIGQIVPLEGEPHKALELFLNTETGPVMIGKGRLGAYKKKKAVKLTSDLGAECPEEG